MKILSHKFIKNIPEELEDDVLYISLEYPTAIHKCCCGCGSEVVTPLTPTDWKLIFDGKTVSLYPSIGNWALKCKSHYWITNNQVKWAPTWTKEEIDEVREQEVLEKENYYGSFKEDKKETIPIKIKRWLSKIFK